MGRSYALFCMIIVLARDLNGENIKSRIIAGNVRYINTVSRVNLRSRDDLRSELVARDDRITM